MLPEYASFARRHAGILLALVALVAIPQIVFWSFAYSFGTTVRSVADSTLFFSFYFHILASAVLSSALAGLLFGTFLFLLGFSPTKLFKRLTFRKFYRWAATSLFPRYFLFLGIFSQFYLNSSFWWSFVIPGIAAIALSKITEWISPRKSDNFQSLEELAKRMDGVNQQVEGIRSKLELPDADRQRIESEIAQIQKESEQIAGLIRPHSFKAKKELKSAKRKMRRLLRQKDIFLKSALGIALAFPIVVGAGRADKIRNTSQVSVEISNGLDSRVLLASVIGQTRSHILLYVSSEEKAVAYPSNQVTLRDKSAE